MIVMPTTVTTIQVRENTAYLPVGLIEEMGETIASDDRLSVARKTSGSRAGAWIGFTPKGRYNMADGSSGYVVSATFFEHMFGHEAPYRVTWTGQTYKYVYDDTVVPYYRLERVQ